MYLLRTIFFVIGNVFGYCVTNHFYNRPVKNELINEIEHLKSEMLKKATEKTKLTKPKTIKKGESESEEATFNEIPDPVIDSLWVTYLTYFIYGVFFGKIVTGWQKPNLLSKINAFLRDQVVFKAVIFLGIKNKKIQVFILITRFLIFLSSLLALIKIALSLFSSLVFKVHSFRWNLFEAYNLKFYFSWRGLINFFLNIAFFFLGLVLVAKNNNDKGEHDN